MTVRMLYLIFIRMTGWIVLVAKLQGDHAGRVAAGGVTADADLGRVYTLLGGVAGQPADDVFDFLDLGGVLRSGGELVFDDVGEISARSAISRMGTSNSSRLP